MSSIIPLSLQTLGTLLIAYAALSVHHRFLREHKVDEKVFTTMRVEQMFGLLGVFLTITGYFLEILFLA
jgi:hypothetical protein